MALTGSLTFLSASLTGSANIKVDFAGLNTLIVDPITGSHNELGFHVSEVNDSIKYFNERIEPIGDSESPNQLNSLLLHRNGAYQYPMWKQWRGYNHPVARKLRLSNTMSIDASRPLSDVKYRRDKFTRHRLKYGSDFDLNTGFIFRADRLPPNPKHGKNDKPGLQFFHTTITTAFSHHWPELKHYYEPPVVSKFKPILYEYENLVIKQTFMNETHYFSNTSLNAHAHVHDSLASSSMYGQTYKSKLKYYQVYNAARAMNGAENLLYSETIFPTEINTYRTYKLRRPSYEEKPGLEYGFYDYAKNRTFWKNMQGGGQLVSATDNIPTRMRSPDSALNFVGVKQTANFLEKFDTDSLRSAIFASSGSLSYYMPPKAHYRGLFGYNNNYATASLRITGAIGHIRETPNHWPAGQKSDCYLIITGGLANASGVGLNNYGTTFAHSASHAARRYVPTPAVNHVPYNDALGHAAGFTEVESDMILFYEGGGSTAALVTAQALSGAVSQFQGTYISCSIDVVDPEDDVTITFHQIWGGSEFNGLEIFASNEAKSSSFGKAWRGTDPVPRSPGHDVPNRLTFEGGMGATYDPFNRGALSGGAWQDGNSGQAALGPSYNRDLNSALNLPLIKFDRKYNNSESDKDIKSWGHRIYYINNGIVANPIVNTTASTVDVDGNPQRNQGVVPDTTDYHGLGHPFTQLSAYQPFSLAALSSWPLDVRNDIFDSTVSFSNVILTQEGEVTDPLDVLDLGEDGFKSKLFEPIELGPSPVSKYIFEKSTLTKTHYLTSSVGGKGLMIGFSPHTLTASIHELMFAGDYGPGSTDFIAENIRTGHITRSVGSLVYSTKPTIFFYRRHGQEESANTEGGLGYIHPTASMQYMRHTYPYQSPFFVTDRLVNRAPFFDSYYEFIEKDLESIGRDYSIVPEFRISDHLGSYASLISNFKNITTIGQAPQSMPGMVHAPVNLANYAVAAQPTGETAPAENSYISTDGKLYKLLLPAYKHPVQHVGNFLSLLGADVTSSAYNLNFHEYDNEGNWQAENETVHEWDHLSGTVATARTDVPIVSGSSGQPSVWNTTYKVDPISVEFYEKYSHCDKTGKYSNLIGGPLTSVPLNHPGVDTISFNIKAIRKLLPYSGFYPVTRTTQIGTDFAIGFLTNLNSHQFANHRPGRRTGADTFVPATLTSVGFPPDTYKDYGIWNGVPGTSKPDNFNAVPLGQLYPTGVESPGSSADALQRRRREIKLRAQLQSIIEPLMAPGILYNSIKSGMAVDYPIYTMPPKFFAPLAFTGSWITQSFDYGGGYMMGAARAFPAILTTQPNVRMPFEALYNFQQLKSTFKSPAAYSDPANKTTSKFQYDTFRSNYLVPDFVDYDLVPSSSMYFRGPASGHDQHIVEGVGRMKNLHGLTASYAYTPNAGIAENLKYDYKMDLYYSAVNNFLAETMNFYLQDLDPKVKGVKLPIVVSNPNESQIAYNGVKTQMISMEEKEYAMGVTLTMGKEQVLCEGPRNSGFAKRTVEYDKWVWGDINGDGTTVTQSIAPTRYQQTSSIRGYVFGPPVEIVHHEFGETNFVHPDDDDFLVDDDGTLVQNRIRWDDYSSYFAANLQDPAYQAFTPPYFYGDSTVIFRFNNTGFDTFGATGANDPVEEANVSSIKKRASGAGITGSYSYEKYDLSGLCTSIPSTSSVSVGSATRMKLNSCMDLFDSTPVTLYVGGKEGDPDGFENTIDYEFWHVQMKWTSPVLNFFHSSSYFHPTTPVKEGTSAHAGFGAWEQKFEPLPGPKTQHTASNPWHDETTGRGLWGGHGTCPYDGTLEQCLYPPEMLPGKIDDGIYLKFHEVKLLSSDDSVAQAGSFDDQVIGFGNTGLESNNGYYSALDLFLGDVTATGKVAGDKQFLIGGSMIKDLNLFSEREFEIGRINSTGKKVSEAVVIIPYFENPIRFAPNIHADNEDALLNEIYATREIIPGKHFLPIHKKTFQHIFSTIAVHTYNIHPSEARNFLGGEEFANAYQPGTNFAHEPVVGGTAKSNFNQVVNHTDCGRMISTLLGTSPFFDRQYTDLWNTGYQLPPEFDFINNGAVDPFQMIIVPFTETFGKQDLVNIYQNIMPDSSLRATHTRSQSTVNPGKQTIINDRVFPGMRVKDAQGQPIIFTLSDIDNGNFLRPYHLSLGSNISNILDNVNKTDPNWTKKGFYKNLRFMVFKIKQRGIKNYENYKRRQIITMIEERIKEIPNQTRAPSMNNNLMKSLQRDEIYGPNWPYDYFSLIEAIKIDIEMGWGEII